jgi:methylmalonyl-CoA mutase N-terminal domain/subunit
MRIMRDMIVWSARNLARYNPINISGYHISEAGATSVQELAFTMANAIAYVEEVTGAGVPVDEFAPRLAFYFVAQADFFEEVAKFRAARRIYARLMKERFGATRAESMRLRFHCQTAAATLTKAQPLNNVIRTALQALSAVLGGAQSLHTNGMDEAYAIPSEEAMKIALRTQQIIALETNVTSVVDPLGGLLLRGDAHQPGGGRGHGDPGQGRRSRRHHQGHRGGLLPARDRRLRLRLRPAQGGGRAARDRRQYPGRTSEPPPIPIHKVDPAVEARQVARLGETRRRRDQALVDRLLDRLEREAREAATNLMPVTIELVRARRLRRGDRRAPAPGLGLLRRAARVLSRVP